MFGKVDGDHGGDSEAASKAAGAVSAVSGEQILSAIVKAAGAAAGAAAGEQEGKKPGDATNPIAAAIGDKDGDAEFGKEEMKKDDQIAAAIALRGMAKDGKFAVKSNGGEKGKAEGAIKGAAESVDKLVTAVKTAEGASSGTDAIGEVVADNKDAKAADKASVTGIAKGIKEIVEAAGGSEKLKVAAATTGENNKKAGKLFGKVDANANGDSEAASKAAGAVSAVSGEQILSAIVTAAGAAEQEGEKPEDAKNPIAAAIGKGNEDGADFNQEGMKKDDQIAAAIALRGMAKDGKFAVKNNEKGKAEGAIKEVSELLDKLVTAVKTAEGASSGTDAIGEVEANAGAAKAADKTSVTGIAKGIKEIVEAAGGSEKLKVAAAKGGIMKRQGSCLGKLMVMLLGTVRLLARRLVLLVLLVGSRY